MGDRMRWMDQMRGGAVVLVLLFHAGMFGAPRVVWAFNQGAGGFRLAALFFASGMLLQHSLSKGARRYFDGKLRRIVWPYLLWSLVVLSLIGWDYGVNPGWWIFPVGSHTWFLSTLAGLYVIGFLLRAVNPLFVAVPLLAASQVISIEAWPYLHDVSWWGFFFFLGAGLSTRAEILTRVPVWLFLAGLAIAGGWAAGQVLSESPPARKGLLGALVVMVGLGVILWALARFPRTRPLVWLEWLGRRSVVTYLVHYPVLLLLDRIGVPSGTVGFWFAFFVTLVVCVGVTWAYPWVRFLFELPPAGSRTRSASSPATQAG